MVIRGCNKNKPWFNDDCRHAFDLKQEAHLCGLVIALELTGMNLTIGP